MLAIYYSEHFITEGILFTVIRFNRTVYDHDLQMNSLICSEQYSSS